MSDIKQVIVMRTDLNMRKGKMVSQGAHSAIIAVFLGGCRNDSDVEKWFEEGMTKICVGIDTEDGLLSIHKQAEAAGLITGLVKDKGTTEFGGIPTFTCVAVGPGKSGDIDKITGGLKLL